MEPRRRGRSADASTTTSSSSSSRSGGGGARGGKDGEGELGQEELWDQWKAFWDGEKTKNRKLRERHGTAGELLRKARGTAMRARDVVDRGETVFETRHEGQRPFKVVVSPASSSTSSREKQHGRRHPSVRVRIYGRDGEGKKGGFQRRPLLTIDNPRKIWVGKSPLMPATELSGSHGREFDGNSLLIEGGDGRGDGRAVFVGHRVFEFEPRDRITAFLSPVGGAADTPYPWAADAGGRTYLLALEPEEWPVLNSPPLPPQPPEDTLNPYDTFFNQVEFGRPIAPRLRWYPAFTESRNVHPKDLDRYVFTSDGKHPTAKELAAAMREVGREIGLSRMRRFRWLDANGIHPSSS